MGSVTLQPVGSSRTRGGTCVLALQGRFLPVDHQGHPTGRELEWKCGRCGQHELQKDAINAEKLG